MTKDASFKKVVRRHAEETGQRYTEALTDLEGLGARMHHEPDPERLLVHIRDRYGVDPVAATKLSVHKTYVFRIDRNDGSPWVGRAFPPARPRAGVEGDAAILGFLLGLRHASDPDHVVAISTIVARHRSAWAASRVGVAWGLGHSLTIVAVGSALVALGVAPDNLLEAGVLGHGTSLPNTPSSPSDAVLEDGL